MPCGDDDNCVEFDAYHTEKKGSHENHEEKSCSPFCACACCGCRGFDISPLHVVTIITKQRTENKIAPYKAPFISQFTANIWQPPKIS